MGNFDEDIMIVGWQTNKDLISLLIDERKNKMHRYMIKQKQLKEVKEEKRNNTLLYHLRITPSKTCITIFEICIICK